MDSSSVRLGDLCDPIKESVDPTGCADSTYVGLEHLESARFTRCGETSSSAVRSMKSAFRRGDVLYGKLRPYLDKAVLAQDDGICTTELLVLRPRADVDPRFLLGVLHCPDFVNHAVRGTTGAQHPRTSWSHVRDFRIPSRVRTDHGEIAAFLWLLHSAFDACEESARQLKDLKHAAMRTLFTRGLRGEPQRETEIGPIPETWNLVELAAVQESIRYGTSVRCSHRPTGFPVLRIPNIEAGRINTENLKFCESHTVAPSRYTLQGGDLLFVRTNGVLERLGACAVYDGTPGGALFASYLIRSRLMSDRVVPRFVAYFFGSEIGRRAIADRATPAADGKFNLNAATISDLPLPVPTRLEEQREIVAVLDVLDRKAELHRRKRAVLDDLFKALLHKLMTGQIRVTDLDLPTR